MNRKFHFLIAFTIISSTVSPAFGQSTSNLGSDTGQQYNITLPGYTTSQAGLTTTPGITTAAPGETFTTGGQTSTSYGALGPVLAPATTTQFGGVAQGLPTTYLPPTVLDSFVYNSGMSDAIYGDEGTTGPPPYEYFQAQNTIGAGMAGSNILTAALDALTTGTLDSGLTTGHSSLLPSAWLDTTPDSDFTNTTAAVTSLLNDTAGILNTLSPATMTPTGMAPITAPSTYMPTDIYPQDTSTGDTFDSFF